jgi:Tfp pilus assembly protein PilO
MALDYKSSLSRYRRYLQSVQSQPMWTASMWVVLSLILMIVLVVLALRPTLVTISTLFGQIKQQTEIARKLDEKIMSVRKATDALEAVREKIPLLEEALPESPKWETLVTTLESIIAEQGMTTTSITVDKISQPTEAEKSVMPAGVLPVKFLLVGNGSYEQIRGTIERVEKMGRLVLFRNIVISQNKDGSLGLALDGVVGYLPESKVKI